MPSLNCSQTKHSGGVPEGACTRTLCAPLLSAPELERFRVSALTKLGDARLERTHGSPPATWSKVLRSQVILEEGMRLCRYRIDSSNCSDLKNGIYEVLTSSTALFSSTHVNLTLLLQSFHLTCHFWCLPRKGPALSEAAFFTYLPCSQF